MAYFFLLLFSPSNLFLLYHSSGIQHPLFNDGGRSSLLQFKQSFVFDKFSCDPSTDYTRLDSWKGADDCCSWDVVDCDDQTGHVTGLNLSSSCLYGSINSSSPLFRLLHLTSLDLSYNNFNLSIIPGGIRSLSELKYLNLSWANFSGQIPLEILELSQLVSLNLWKNPLVLQKPSLKDVVETLTNLSELVLSGVNISSHVPQSLSNLTSLITLFLRNCLVYGPFPPDVFQLPNLRILSLRFNPDLTGYLPEFQVGSPLEMLGLDGTNFAGQLPHSIGNLRSLRYFDARGCGFVGLIPSSIGNLTKLEALDLSYNYFSGNIPSTSLGNLLQLTSLSLSSNNFSPGTLEWIGKLTNIQALNFEKTNSYGVIPSSFRNLTQLTLLWLDFNYLTGEIPSWVGNLTQLFTLYVSDNKLKGSIPESFFGLPNLEILHLYHNNLSGSFLQMKHLSQLHLSLNHFSIASSPYTNVTLAKFQMLGLGGCNVREFPSFLRGQNELQYLELGSNNIEGYIPNWISTLESLVYVGLSNNSLTGFEQPLSIHSLPTLSAMDLSVKDFEGPLPIPPPSIQIYKVSQNKFNGNISPFFCNLTSISVIDLSSNNLSGKLPPCLGNFASVLDLHNNSLSGEIPDRFTSGCTLKMMDLSQNLLGGQVPNSLAKCSKLEILNLEQNQMDGVFPSWLGILPRLRIMSLRSNKFHGAIGKPLANMSSDSYRSLTFHTTISQASCHWNTSEIGLP